MNGELRQLDMARAERCLADVANVSVIWCVDYEGRDTEGGLVGQMPRDKALSFLANHGAFVAGPHARRAHHGICSFNPHEKQTLFFETRHE